jgi:monoamine oxidase
MGADRTEPEARGTSRRALLAMIGTIAGSAAMYHAMTRLGFAADSTYRGLPNLQGAPAGSSVLVLGAGLAGLTAALELRKAGYAVEILEFQQRAGGRNWTLRGGDTVTEMGGAVQRVGFDAGLYVNPGPWRIPYHHAAVLDACRRHGVALEPFIQVNNNALLHSSRAFGGKPVRWREIQADFHGHVAELLGKATNQGALDGTVTAEEKEMLLEALREWGALDASMAYGAGPWSSGRRGYAVPPGGGIDGAPRFSTPLSREDVLKSGLWLWLLDAVIYEFQTTMFQPVGGMDAIGRAMAAALGPEAIRFGRKVTEIRQDPEGVRVIHVDAAQGGAPLTSRAQWCVCTLPLTVLSQMQIDCSPAMRAAIEAVPYYSVVKAGLQFRRRFWEEDEGIFGGVSYTDLPITSVSYPSHGCFGGGKGVLQGAYAWENPASYALSSLDPEERVRQIVAHGAVLHPQYAQEYENGVAIAWHRVPWTLGCAGNWTEDARRMHYANLCALDNRLILAGEHASYLPAWQEGAILSALDAVVRLHRRAMGG